jgi:hypothetical protein
MLYVHLRRYLFEIVIAMAKSKLFRITLFFAFLLLVASCTTNNKPSKVRSIGNTSEILVVVENLQQWENSIGKVIKRNLGRDQTGLSQPEPLFDLAHLTKNSFSDLLKKHRNILIVEIDKNQLEPKMEVVENLWAEPQVIIRITAPNKDLFISTLEKNIETFIEKYDKAERDRILAVFSPTSKNKVTAEIAKKVNLKMTIPDGFFLAKSEPDFIWVRKEVSEFSQGIIIFREPYLDTAQFSKASISARTMRMLKQYVPGSVHESYMTLDEAYLVPEPKAVNGFAADYAIELRGLWDVENDFMGGPYVSYTFADNESEYIITVFGYVYNPNKDKRNLLRQVEAILYSTKFTK